MVKTVNKIEFVLNGDENQGSKIFQNIVNNAVKFTPAGGLVIVRVYLANTCRAKAIWVAAFTRYTSSYVASQRGFGACEASHYSNCEECGMYFMLEIEDTGCGVPAAYIWSMFNAFVQLSNGVNKTHQGIGLGLQIVRIQR